MLGTRASTWSACTRASRRSTGPSASRWTRWTSWGSSTRSRRGSVPFRRRRRRLRVELTAPEIAQTVILTRLPGRTPMPPDEDLARLARSRATLCIFLSTEKIAEAAATLVESYGEGLPRGAGLSRRLARRKDHSRSAGRHFRPDRRRGNRQDGDFPRRLGVAPSAAARLAALRQDVRPRPSSGGRPVKLALISLSGAGADRRARRQGLAPRLPRGPATILVKFFSTPTQPACPRRRDSRASSS